MTAPRNNFNRIRGGYVAKRRGEFFEDAIIVTARRQGVEILDIPDGCQQKGASIIIRVPTPFDFVIAAPGRKAAFFDSKTTERGTFSFSSIDWRQVHNLCSMASCGFPAGYLIHHRTLERVVFYSTSIIQSISEGASLRPQLGTDIGHISDFDIRLILG